MEHAVLDKYRALAQIVNLMSANQKLLGRTKFQKIVFLLETLEQKDVGYNFRFYNYGPFSNELAGDIDFLSKIDVFDCRFYVDKSFYEITPGNKISEYISEPSISSEIDPAIRSIVNDYGSKTAEELELIATLVFVNKFDPIGKLRDSLIAKTVALKPKFSETQVSVAIESLTGKLFFNSIH